MNNIAFNPDKHFLGQLCRHGHEWENTGKSLRVWTNDRKTHRCTVCVDLHNRRHTGDNEHYKKQYAEYGKSWYEKNRERLREERKVYREKNSDKIRESRKRYREQNREALLESNRDYYRRNRTKVLIRTRNYQIKNKEALRLKQNLYRLENLEKIQETRKAYLSTPEGRESLRQAENRRRARKAGCHTHPYNRGEVLAKFEGYCAYCGFKGKLDIDHFIPISKGGSDCLGNAVPACDRCNSSKWNRDPLQWYKSQPFYSKQRWQMILKVLGKNENNYNQLPLF